MKKLLAAVLSVIIIAAPVQKAHAIASVVMAVGGAAGAGAVALAGIASPVVGTVIFRNDYDEWSGLTGFMAGTVVGLLLLDEKDGTVTFNQIDADLAQELSIKATDAEIYNSEIEEANILFEEVRANLTGDSSVEESRELWQEMKDFVSPETFTVMKKLTSNQ